MTFDEKADMAQPKDPEKAKPQTTKKPHVSPTAETLQETGGPKGPEPTRYGDWENNGRCTDF